MGSRLRGATHEAKVLLSQVGIDGAYGGLNAAVPGGQARLGGVARLVERVVADGPRVVLAVLGQLLSEPDGTILEVLGAPELVNVVARVRAPVAAVTYRHNQWGRREGGRREREEGVCGGTSGGGVQVQDGVDALVGAEIGDVVEPLEGDS